MNFPKLNISLLLFFFIIITKLQLITFKHTSEMKFVQIGFVVVLYALVSIQAVNAFPVGKFNDAFRPKIDAEKQNPKNASNLLVTVPLVVETIVVSAASTVDAVPTTTVAIDVASEIEVDYTYYENEEEEEQATEDNAAGTITVHTSQSDITLSSATTVISTSVQTLIASSIAKRDVVSPNTAFSNSTVASTLPTISTTATATPNPDAILVQNTDAVETQSLTAQAGRDVDFSDFDKKVNKWRVIPLPGLYHPERQDSIFDLLDYVPEENKHTPLFNGLPKSLFPFLTSSLATTSVRTRTGRAFSVLPKPSPTMPLYEDGGLMQGKDRSDVIPSGDSETEPISGIESVTTATNDVEPTPSNEPPTSSETKATSSLYSITTPLNTRPTTPNLRLPIPLPNLTRRTTKYNINADTLRFLVPIARYAQIAGCVVTTRSIMQPFKCIYGCDQFRGQTKMLKIWHERLGLENYVSAYLAADHTEKRVVLALKNSNHVIWDYFQKSRVGMKDYLPYNTEAEVWNNTKTNMYFCGGSSRDGECRVHAGMLHMYKQYMRVIDKAVVEAFANPELKGYKLIITGHSFAGGIATLIGADYKMRGFNPTVVSFGSPKIGNKNWADWFDKLYSTEQDETMDRESHRTFYRVTKLQDQTGLMPVGFGYAHTSGEVFIGTLEDEPKAAAVYICKGQKNRRCLARHLPQPHKTISSPLHYHFNYFVDFIGCAPDDMYLGPKVVPLKDPNDPYSFHPFQYEYNTEDTLLGRFPPIPGVPILPQPPLSLVPESPPHPRFPLQYPPIQYPHRPYNPDS